jgi:hypothetical protein
MSNGREYQIASIAEIKPKFIERTAKQISLGTGRS